MLPCFFCFVKGFASAEATRGLSGRPLDPFGAHLLKRMGATKNRFLVGGKEKSFTFFFRFLGDFASAEATKGLSDRPLETFGPLQQRGGAKNRFLVDGKGKTFLTSSRFTEGFASAEATKGLSARPLETFGPILVEALAS